MNHKGVFVVVEIPYYFNDLTRYTFRGYKCKWDNAPFESLNEAKEWKTALENTDPE